MALEGIGCQAEEVIKRRQECCDQFQLWLKLKLEIAWPGVTSWSEAMWEDTL